MTNTRKRLRRLSNLPRWKIAIFTVAVNLLLFWQTIIDYYFYLNFNFLFARRAFVKRSKQRAHWVGSQIVKPHRLAFSALAAIVLAGIFSVSHIQTALYWVIGWGSAFSLFVIYRSLTILQRAYSHSRRYQRRQN